MPRPPRAFVPSCPQHLIQRGNNRTPIFLADADHTFFLDCLRDVSRRHGVAIHAYVLMTNHVHLLVTPTYADSLARLMQSMGRRYVRYFNTKYQRSGTLWEGRFKACLIDTDAYLLSCYRYIELNQIRAKMAQYPGEYPWSSYRMHTFGEHNSLITKHGLYLAFGVTNEERQAAYRQFCALSLDQETLQQIRRATNKGWVLGSEDLRHAAEAQAQRPLRPLPRGRPRKPLKNRL